MNTTEMRRNEKEITSLEEKIHILNTAVACRIGLSTEEGPYIVPMNFGWETRGGKGAEKIAVYLHCAGEGRKLPLLKSGKRLCFQTDTSVGVEEADSPCSWGMKYKSLIGWGRPVIIEEQTEKNRTLNLIMKKYGGGDENVFSGEALARTVVFQIELEELTGKKS